MNDVINFYNANKEWVDKVLIILGSILLNVLSLIYTKVSHRSSQARLDALEKSDLKGLYVECPRCGSKIYLSEVKIYKEVIADEAQNFKETK